MLKVKRGLFFFQPRVDRCRYVTKRDLAKHGYADEFQACTQLACTLGKFLTENRFRDRIDELMAEDDRVSSRAAPEAEGVRRLSV